MKLKQLRKEIQRELKKYDAHSYDTVDVLLEQIEEEYGLEARNKAIRDFKLDEEEE